MSSNLISKNYNTIMSNFLSYLPSRLLVVLNSLIIVPILAHILTSDEVGVFQLSIGILNLVCTMSGDWIAKSALRFYEKYKLLDKLDDFFSNAILLTIVMYGCILLAFIFFSDFVSDKLLISKHILLLTLFIVVPAGIRQFLYQMLRVFNRPFLYTFSIVLYQISLLVLFLGLCNVLNNVYAILFAMIFAMFLVDVFILYQMDIGAKFALRFDVEILVESLKYALPLILTNTSIWVILNINKFVFQYNEYYADTAVAGISWLLVTSILTPIFSTFLFAVFPAIVKKFETNNRIKPFVTNTIQLYCALFVPIAGLFCYYSKEITHIAFSNKYQDAYIVISFFAVSLFVHELMKLFNIKYHLKNRTYVEMAMSIFVGLICLGLNFFLIPKFHLIGAGISMFVSILLLFALNLIVQFRGMDYVSFFKILKTMVLSFCIGFAAFMVIKLVFLFQDLVYFNILKMVLYTFLTYALSFVFAKKLLA